METKTTNQKVVKTLRNRDWVRLIVIYLFMPVLLFVCGWDLGWWQAWVYSVLVLLAGIGRRLWAEQRHPGLLAERNQFAKAPAVKSWDRVLAPLMAVSVVSRWSLWQGWITA
jgi:hypothetical protein